MDGSTPSNDWQASEPGTVLAPATPRNERCVGLHCDNLSAGRAWAQGLAAEGLRVHVQAADDQVPMAAEARLLHITGPLAEQLGLLRRLRTLAPHTPLVVAVQGLRDLDQVLSLEMGADDAVDTRTAWPVVAARLRSLWRRDAQRRAAEPAGDMRFGSLELQWPQRCARLQGQPVPLSEGEFEVLWLLARQAGNTVSRRELLRQVRGLDDHPLDRSIDNRVYRIRAKLHDACGPLQRIRTVRNHGYVFSPSGW